MCSLQNIQSIWDGVMDWVQSRHSVPASNFLTVTVNHIHFTIYLQYWALIWDELLYITGPHS
jgi:hypothetical protein